MVTVAHGKGERRGDCSCDNPKDRESKPDINKGNECTSKGAKHNIGEKHITGSKKLEKNYGKEQEIFQHLTPTPHFLA